MSKATTITLSSDTRDAFRQRADALGMKVDDFTRALLKMFDSTTAEFRQVAVKFRNDILSNNKQNTRPIRKNRAITNEKQAV